MFLNLMFKSHYSYKNGAGLCGPDNYCGKVLCGYFEKCPKPVISFNVFLSYVIIPTKIALDCLVQIITAENVFIGQFKLGH